MPVQVEKYITVHGLVATLESSYGGDDARDETTDAVLTAEPVTAEIGHIHEGARDQGFPAPLERAAPSGRAAQATIPLEFAGPDAAYASGTTPECHALLRAAGLAATIDATAGSEKIDYVPEVDPGSGYASLAMDLYTRGQRWPVHGALCDFAFEFEGGGFPRFEFPFQGLVGDPSDTDVPANIAYDDVEPPKAVGVSLDIGNYASPVVRRVRFELGRNIVPRTDANASDGHGGFGAGRIAPTLEVEIEADALASGATPEASAIDPYKMFENAESVALGFEFGAQYNALKLDAPRAMLNAPPAEGDDDDVALWTLTFGLYPSAPGLVDCFTLTAK